MGYFNYHANAKRLIKEGHLTGYEVLEKYNAIAPALVLYFDNYRPLPIREKHFLEYFEIIYMYGKNKNENV